MNLYIKNTVENQEVITSLLEPSEFVKYQGVIGDYLIVTVPQLTYDYYTPSKQFTAVVVNTCDISLIRELVLIPSIEAVLIHAHHHAVLKPIGEV